ncbi:MAG: DEAD/DEAH box helicase [Candidatus Rokubacteria bacterium]|nr:DEAD/DEAH box helicase [Candidatus Rokubacteria bacterium]
MDPVLERFHPAVRAWFTGRFPGPTEPQRHGWPAIAGGQHTLVTAPTGSGKTLAAFLWALDALVQDAAAGRLTDRIHVVYVSPLKALNNDIHRNLAEPLAGIREAARELGVELPELRAAVRTGDTPAPDRAAMGRRPPHILITTPESLFILLASERMRRALGAVRYLIVDEIHAVAGTKRGVHLALTLERLADLAAAPPVRIGLSATVEPVEEVAALLTGCEAPGGPPRPCRVVDVGRRRALDLAVVAPAGDLGAVATNAVWEATYERLAALIRQHRTTLVFAGSRRLAERLAVRLTERLGPDVVAAHHGSLSRRRRLEAEARLKAGEIRAIVATGSLELGIDVGAIDCVCQVESPRAIVTAVQRVGRSGHWLGATPRGRLFALTRDDVLECAALVREIRAGRLDRVEIPRQPLDVLAQQVVAACADAEWETDRLFDLVRRALPYRDLARADFDRVLRMEAERLPTEPRGTAPRIYWDTVRGRVRGRRGARLAVVTSGGTIPDTTDYDVVLEPEGLVLGQVNEDFAQESMRGDIFTLGNSPWRIVRVQRGRMVVESAAGLPPTIPFWHGEAPGRTAELSGAVARLRSEIAERLADPEEAARWLAAEAALEPDAARQAVEYVARQQATAGVVPTDTQLLVERFFDSLGGTQVVLHAPYGMRVNRAWGLALAKRVCRTFNFEIQSSATDDAILLAFGPRHAFPLEAIWSYLSPATVRETLVQAVLQAPLFEARFRQAAVRALLILRHAGGRRVPAYLQKLRATDLLAACFPEQQMCLDNRTDDLDLPVPDHPLVRETLRECLEDALDVRRLEAVLEGLRLGAIRTATREVPAPSPFAHQILAAWNYSFLDDAPLEERRSRAVQSHRGLLAEVATGDQLAGVLDPEAIARVAEEAGGRAPERQARDADELCEALKEAGPQTEAELGFRTAGDPEPFLARLVAEGRAVRADRGSGSPVWIATETLPLCRAAYPVLVEERPVTLPPVLAAEDWDPDRARRELCRRRLRHAGPVGGADLAAALALPPDAVAQALAALEAEGVVFRGRYDPRGPAEQWCERTVLERIHRLTLGRLRAEIEPVGPAAFTDFLCRWQRAGPDARLHGAAGLGEVLGQLQGLERPALAWERDVLAVRVADYRPELLDQLTLSGAFLWGRVGAWTAVAEAATRPGGPPPIAFLARADVGWLRGSAPEAGGTGQVLGGPARAALAALESRGALFVDELARRLRLEPAEVLAALWELARAGLVTSDGFQAVRLLGSLEGRQGLRRVQEGERRPSRSALRLRVTLRTLPGRWSLLPPGEADPETRAEAWADLLLARYGVVFRELAKAEEAAPAWRELVAVYRRREFTGTARRGLFVQPASGEQYALPTAVDHLREVRRRPDTRWLTLSAVDPALGYGSVFPEPRLGRHPGHLVVLRAGRPLLGLDGTRLWASPELAAGIRRDALVALVAERRGRRLTVETVEDRPVLQSGWLDALADVGFHGDGDRLTCDGYPGPRPRPRAAP